MVQQPPAIHAKCPEGNGGGSNCELKCGEERLHRVLRREAVEILEANAQVQGRPLGVAEARSGGGVPCNAQLGRAWGPTGARLSRRSPQLRLLDTLMQGFFARNQEAHVNLDEIAA